MNVGEKRVSRRWRTAAVLAIGIAVGTVMVATPAVAHVGGTVSHLWNQHIKPKADARYANAVPGTDKAKKAANLTCSNCVASTEIRNEAGSTALVGQNGIAIPTTAGVLTSKTIHVPGPGKVIAMATGSVFMSGLGAADSYLIRLKLNSGSSTSVDEDGNVIFIRDTNSNSGTGVIPFAASRQFTVRSAGAFTVNITGWLQVDPGASSVDLDDRSLTLVYVPTDYS